MKKFLSFLLAMAMLVTLAVPVAMAEGETGTETETTATAPEYPEGAAISVSSSGNVIGVTYPNSAVDSEGVIAPAYKVEVLATDASNNLVTTQVYATESQITDASAMIPRRFTLKAQRGNFTVNVYPMSTTDETTALFGAPLTADVTMTEPVLPNGAVRYELEDYVPEAYQAKHIQTLSYASGGKVFTARNGSGDPGAIWFSNSAPQIDEATDMSFEVEIDVPYDGNYILDFVAGKYAGGHVTQYAISIDDATEPVISRSTASYADLSISGTYPWKHIPMQQYRATGVNLTAGKHTLKFKHETPSNGSHIFALDYLQVTPQDFEVVADDADTWIEFEDYQGKLITDDGVGTNTTTNKIYYSANTSAGASLHTDSYADGDKGLEALMELPLYVETAGVYDMEYVASVVGSTTKFYIDETDLTAFYPSDHGITPIYTATNGKGTSLESLGLDVMDVLTTYKEDGSIKTKHWSYFYANHHKAERFRTSIYLPAGHHTITMELGLRSAGNVAICMDYLKLTPVAKPTATIAASGSVIELDTYAPYFVEDSKRMARYSTPQQCILCQRKTLFRYRKDHDNRRCFRYPRECGTDRLV